MEKIHPWSINKISTIYNGVDLKKYFSSNSFDEKINDFDFLVLGSIRKLNNVEGMIRSVKIYREKYGDNIKINWEGKVSHTHYDLSAYNDAKKYLVLLQLNK